MSTIAQHQDGTSVASVRTITAEVRVLTVGSRQITLSVANQLDWVERDLIDPMGRIRLKDGEQLIGRNVEDGTLVRSSMSCTRTRMEHPFWVEPPAPFVVCSETRTQRNQDTWAARERTYLLRFEGVAIAVPPGATEQCEFLHGEHTKYCNCELRGKRHSAEPKCGGWLARGQEEFIRAEIAEQRAIREADIALMRHDEALPLIVLAGLR